MKQLKQYALYKGDAYLYGGTIKELSEYLGVSERTIRYYSYPVNKRRKKNKRDYYLVIKVEDDEREINI